VEARSPRREDVSDVRTAKSLPVRGASPHRRQLCLGRFHVGEGLAPSRGRVGGAPMARGSRPSPPPPRATRCRPYPGLVSARRLVALRISPGGTTQGSPGWRGGWAGTPGYLAKG